MADSKSTESNRVESNTTELDIDNTDDERDSDEDDVVEKKGAAIIQGEIEVTEDVVPIQTRPSSIKQSGYFIIPVIIMCVSFFIPLEVLKLGRENDIILSCMICHFITYIVVHIRSNKRFEHLSMVDDLNIFPWEVTWTEFKDGVSFKNSLCYDSISDSVCGRGSTMNKLMIGTGYSIGITIMMKFYIKNGPEYETLYIGGLSILMTSVYENKIIIPEGHLVRRFYKCVHYCGVLCYIILPFIWIIRNEMKWVIWSIANLIIALTFIMLMKLMNKSRSKRSLCKNKSISVTLISIESIALISQTLLYICIE